jgi:hypothetical protein
MSNYQTYFLHIGKIAGMYYTMPGRKVSSIIVYGIGAPLPPDDGRLSDAHVILNHDIDLFVPDYIGYGRSEGIFTPLNCVKTFLDLYEFLSKGCIARCNYIGLKKKLQYNDIHFVGRSFGGAYVSLLPKFNSQITNICMIYPMLNWENIGKTTGVIEESVEDFFKAMVEDGYQYLYRGILSKMWRQHFAGIDGLNPISNISYLKDARVFIGHGRKDRSIYFGNSVEYYNALIKLFPGKKDQFLLKLYPFDHSKKTSNEAIQEYLRYVGISPSRDKWGRIVSTKVPAIL